MAQPVPAVCLALALGTDATGGPLADLVDKARPTGSTIGTQGGEELRGEGMLLYHKLIKWTSNRRNSGKTLCVDLLVTCGFSSGHCRCRLCDCCTASGGPPHYRLN